MSDQSNKKTGLWTLVLVSLLSIGVCALVYSQQVKLLGIIALNGSQSWRHWSVVKLLKKQQEGFIEVRSDKAP